MLALVVPSLADAQQERLPLVPGITVRVQAPPYHRWLTGTVESLANDSLILLGTRGDRVAFPVQLVRRLQVRASGQSNVRVWIGVGFTIGAVPGALLGATSGSFILDGTSESALAGAALFGAAGAGLGAILGMTLSGDRWEEISLPRSMVTLAPDRNGVRLHVTFPF
jgi:hypothetical protein